jgi:hypothetical protein
MSTSIFRKLLKVYLPTIACVGLLYGQTTSAAASEKKEEVARGPLRVLPSNPRYFTDGTGKAIYMTGAHIFNTFQDWSDHPSLDYEGHLNFLQSHNHNFIRMWVWENALVPQPQVVQWPDHPLPYQRVGPGTDLSGRPKFDMTELNQAYFDRLRSRVMAAQTRNIYVSVMLFQGSSVDSKGLPMKTWLGHPFNINNNVNGIDGDLNGDGEGTEIQTLKISAITALQEAYVRKIIDTLNDLDNVLYEICNESHGDSEAWQYHMIAFIKEYEATKPKQHPVGMTVEWPGSDNSELFDSPSDWISPFAVHKEGGSTETYDYRRSPPAADGKKVIIADTDHFGGFRGTQEWVWKSFLRGLNPIFLDLDPIHLERYPHFESSSKWDSIRRAMGDTREFSERIDLASMTPRSDVASSGYCLANEGREFLVYLPEDFQSESVTKTVSVDLSTASTSLAVEWFNPRTAQTIPAGTTNGSTMKDFTAPFPGNAVLYLHSQN